MKPEVERELASNRQRIEGIVDRMRENARPDPDTPLYRCVCKDVGWLEITDPVEGGVGMMKRCEQCNPIQAPKPPEEPKAEEFR